MILTWVQTAVDALVRVTEAVDSCGYVSTLLFCVVAFTVDQRQTLLTYIKNEREAKTI